MRELPRLVTSDELITIESLIPGISSYEWRIFSHKKIPEGFEYAVCKNGQYIVRLKGYKMYRGSRYEIPPVIMHYNENAGYYAWLYGQVHRAVMFCFSTEYDEQLEVDHIDGDKHNNNFDNLQMMRGVDNIRKFWSSPEFESDRERWREKHRQHYAENREYWSKLIRENYKKFASSDRYQDYLRKMSESRKGEGNPMYGTHHSEEHKHIMSEKLSGRVFITDGQCNKMIHLSELEKYESAGWCKGRTLKHEQKIT